MRRGAFAAARPPDGDADAAEAGPADADADDGDATGDAVDAAPKPPPVAAAGSRLVVPGAAALVGTGLDSCTNAPAASGDRWCAFARPAASRWELWVIDATKAAAGADVACDGTDVSCLRLSGHLFKSRANGFSDSGFNGDTLIYGETPDQGDSTSPFFGVLWAWRPGWTAGRALTSASGLYCVGQRVSDAALCFENRSGDGMITNLTLDLHAGRLSAAAGPVLPKLDTLLVVATTDLPGAPARTQVDLAPDGAYAAWSTRVAMDAVETLYAQKLADGAAPLVVAHDVSQWAISPDGLAWYWLAGYNYDVTGAPAGTLQAAAFPDGSNATMLAAAVGDLSVVNDKGLWFRADVAAQVGTLRWLPDRDVPAGAATVDTKVLTVLDHARDGAPFLYAKSYTPVRSDTPGAGFDLVDLYSGAAAGGAPCVVADTPTAVHATIAPAGDVVIWDRYDALTGERQGLSTNVSSCASTPFATRLRAVLPAGDDAYLYLDDADDSADESTLRYARVVNGALAVQQPLQTRAAHVFAPLAPALAAVAYTVATGTAADGLYVSTLDTLPATPAGDASTLDTAADGSDGGAEP